MPPLFYDRAATHIFSASEIAVDIADFKYCAFARLSLFADAHGHDAVSPERAARRHHSLCAIDLLLNLYLPHN